MRNLNQNGQEFDLIAESGSNDFDSSATTIRQVIIATSLAKTRERSKILSGGFSGGMKRGY